MFSCLSRDRSAKEEIKSLRESNAHLQVKIAEKEKQAKAAEASVKAKNEEGAFESFTRMAGFRRQKSSVQEAPSMKWGSKAFTPKARPSGNVVKKEVIALIVIVVAILVGIVFRRSVPWKAVFGVGSIGAISFPLWVDKRKKAKLYTEGDGCPEALNQLLEFFWPHISRFVTEKIKTAVEPAVRNALPPMLQSGFSFDREYCNLGETAIQFPTARVHESTQLTDSGSIAVLVLKTEVLWEADLSVKLNFGEFSLGVKSLTIKGELIIEFVDLKDSPPFFEGIRYFFLNMPEMDLEFSGAIVGLNLDMIKQKILGVIEDQLSKRLVVPARMGQALGDDVDFFRIVKPRPQGVLKMRVHRANGLIAADAATLISNEKSDPYVIASFATDTFRSQTVSADRNPVFNFKFRVLVASISTQTILLELFDEDINVLGGEDDSLGKIRVPIADMVEWGEQTKILDILDAEGNPGSNGTLELSAEYLPLLLDSEHLGDSDEGYIFIGVYHAKDVKVSNEHMQYWVTATFKDPDEQTQKSSPKVSCCASLPPPDEGELEQLRVKRDTLKKYNIPPEELAELLDADPDTLDGNCVTPKKEKKACKHKVVFNHAFETETSFVRQMEVTLELRGQAKEQPEQIFGRRTVQMADIVEKCAGSSVDMLGLGNGVELKIRIQARFFGQASCEVPTTPSRLQKRRTSLMG